MILRQTIVMVLVAFVFLGVAWGGADAIKQEVKKMQGTYQMVLLKSDDNELSGEAVQKFQLTIKGDTFQCTDGDKILAEGTYKVIEVKGKIRKTDLQYTTPDNLRGKTVPQLAEWVDANTFRVCVPKITNLTRPTKLEATAEQSLVVFKRAGK